MPDLIVIIFNGVQANWVHVTQLVGLLTLLGALLHWTATLAANRGKVSLAHAILMFASGCDVLLRALAYLVALLFSLFGKTPPPLARLMMRGPFDNAAAGGVTVLGKKPPTSSRIRIGALAWGGIFLAGYFFVSLAMMAHSNVQPASWDAPTPGVLEGCNAAQLQDAVQTTQDGLREEACVQAYIEHTPDPTYEGALQCAGTTLDLVEQIVQDFKDAHKAPASDAGVMKLEPPTVFEDHLARMHHAADGGAK